MTPYQLIKHIDFELTFLIDLRDASISSGDSSILDELNRRAKFDHDNSRRSPEEQISAMKAEQDRREDWAAGKASNDANSNEAVTSDGHAPSANNTGIGTAEDFAMIHEGNFSDSGSAGGDGSSSWDSSDAGDAGE
jgi:hypothetical protein